MTIKQQFAKKLSESKGFRFAVGYFLMFSLLWFTYFAARPLYYAVMPGSWWIQYEATASDAQLGEEVPLELRRTQRRDRIQFTGVRTILENGVTRAEFVIPSPASERDFAEAEGRAGIIEVAINPERMPQVASVYTVQTCIEFDIQGNQKQYCYVSNEFTYGE